jgi:hypothetical protein
MDTLASKPTRHWRKVALAIVLTSLWHLPLRGQGNIVVAGGQPASEYQVKAAFLLNFVRFVEWPPTASKQPFHLCILGDDPFQRSLDSLVRNESVNGRPIVVRYLARWQPPCDLLFVSASERDPFRTLSQVGPGILTVGEEPGFLSEGGMINFVIEDRRVRFDVDLRAAMRGSVKINSRLLGVARLVLQ